VTDDLALALELADLADAITLPRFGAENLEVARKADATPVTEADTGAERAMRDHLGRMRPSDAVLGEEFGAGAGAGGGAGPGAGGGASGGAGGGAGEGAGGGAGGGRRWILDPIDGTANYIRGIPVWASLIALHDGERPLAAVVSAPALGRRWWGRAGGGAFTSDRLSGRSRRLRVSGVDDLGAAQVSIAGVSDWAPPARREALFELARRTWRSRGFGDFWMHMLVAEGAVDIAIDSPGVSVWDLAAPQLIVEEAGGRLTDLRGARGAAGGEALSSNGRLHDAALAVVGRDP
jgi:histidinol-phosphatase